MKELLKYGIAGGITTAVNLVLFWLFAKAGIYYLLANAVAYYIAVCLNYYFNNKFVFEGHHEKGLIKFIVLRTLSLGVDSVLFWGLVDVAGFEVMKSRIGLTIVIIMLNYLVCKKMIFKRSNE